MKNIYILISTFLGLVFTAQAQVNTFDVITFETNQSSPTSKGYSNVQAHLLAGINWTLPGVYFGTMDAQDYKIGLQSARFRKLNDATGNNGVMTMQENYNFGFEYFGFMAAMYGSDQGGILTVDYSVNNGTTWVALDTFHITNTPQRYEVHDHIATGVRFRISKIDNSASRINVDSIYCVPMAIPSEELTILDRHPEGRIHPSVNKLEVHYDQHILPGTGGNLILFNKTRNTSVSYALSNPNVVVDTTQNELVIENVTLEPECSYYVLLDSTFIQSLFYSDFEPGIYDTSTWTFYTTLPHLSVVNEPFDVCDQWDLLGIFKQYSVEDGSRRWNCDMEQGDNFLTMSGLATNGTAVKNDDWLVSHLPFDFGGRTPTMMFKERKVGSGNGVTREIWYTDKFNINISTTRWSKVATIADEFTNADWKTTTLTLQHDSLINYPGCLALRYFNDNSTETNKVWEWNVDSLMILVDTATSITSIENILPSVAIGYPIQNEKLDVIIFSNENIPDATVVITDILGRKIFENKLSINQGHHKYNMENIKFTPGIHHLSIYTNKGHVTRKFLFNE